MKEAAGIAMMVAGVAAGLYFGVWWAFIGGIVNVIEEVRAPNLNAMNVAIGVAKVIFAGAIGWAAALVGILPGYAIATGNLPRLKATRSR